MKGSILQGMVVVVLMMSAPYSPAAPTPVFQESLELAYMIDYPVTPNSDQEIPPEISLYRELAAIPNAQGVTAIQAAGIDRDPGKVVWQASMSSVPLPGALSLFLTGLLCAAVVARKKLISYRREATLD